MVESPTFTRRSRCVSPSPSVTEAVHVDLEEVSSKEVRRRSISPLIVLWSGVAGIILLVFYIRSMAIATHPSSAYSVKQQGGMPAVAVETASQPQKAAVTPSSLTFSFEAAVEEDGDIKVWAAKLTVRLLPHLWTPSAGVFWQEVKSGCSGEITSSDVQTLSGRLQCRLTPGNMAVVRSASPSSMRRGAVAWMEGPNGQEFVVITGTVEQQWAQQHGLVVFGEVAEDDSSSWETVEQLRSMPLDPPIHLTVSSGRRRLS